MINNKPTDPTSEFIREISGLYKAERPVEEIIDRLRKETNRDGGAVNLEVIGTGHPSVHPWDMVGHAYRREGPLYSAEQVFRALVDEMGKAKKAGKNPQLGLAYNDLGVVLSAKGELEEAVECFAKAAEWDRAQDRDASESMAAKNELLALREIRTRRRKMQEALEEASARLENRRVPGREPHDKIVKIQPARQVLEFRREFVERFLVLCARAWWFSAISIASLVSSQFIFGRLSFRFFLTACISLIVVGAIPRITSIQWKGLLLVLNPWHEPLVSVKPEGREEFPKT